MHKKPAIATGEFVILDSLRFLNLMKDDFLRCDMLVTFLGYGKNQYIFNLGEILELCHESSPAVLSLILEALALVVQVGMHT